MQKLDIQQHLEQHENKGTKRRINSQKTLQGFYKAILSIASHTVNNYSDFIVTL